MGNALIHLPAGGGSGGKGGRFIGGTKLSANATTQDAAAQNDIISKTSGSSEVTLFETTVDKLELGCYAVMLRMKVSDISNSNNLINIKLRANDANGALLAEYNIRPDIVFKKANVYQTIGMIAELSGTKGTKLQVSAKLLANTAAITVGIDYLLVAPAFTAVSAIG